MKISFGSVGLALVALSMGLLAGCAADDGTDDEDDMEEQGETTEDLTGSKAASCYVKSDNDSTAFWQGACRFTSGKGGSFSIRPSKGKFPGGVKSISVTITKPGVADVRGLTSSGVSSRWGTAKRSKSDRACWEGGDFAVCAY